MSSTLSPEQHRFERWLILTVGLIQFVNVLDFMMVMPLGPDFAEALGIPPHQIGWVAGSYTFAAALSGLVGALFLDNYPRKRVLLVTLAGLLGATALAAGAWSLPSLIAARLLAGIFGGPLTSAAIALVADHIPPERRGTAMGKVMGAFAAASVVGVPFGLEMAHWFGWRAPFLSLSAIGLIVLLIAWFHLPAGLAPVHQTLSQRARTMGRCLSQSTAVASFTLMGLAMLSGFLMIPNLAAHLQYNLGFPREHMGSLYMAGGFVSFFGMRVAGRWVDRSSATQVGVTGTLLLCLVIFFTFIHYQHHFPVIVLFACFMLAMSGRNVAAQTLSTRVPGPSERAGFMSVQSAVTHLALSAGAGGSSLILSEQGAHLAGVETLGWTAIAVTAAVPMFFAIVERDLRRRAPQAGVTAH